MTFFEHAVQHKSELLAIQEFNCGLARIIITVEEAKAWFDEQARKYRCENQGLRAMSPDMGELRRTLLASMLGRVVGWVNGWCHKVLSDSR
jgi:hypothetical protein